MWEEKVSEDKQKKVKDGKQPIWQMSLIGEDCSDEDLTGEFQEQFW